MLHLASTTSTQVIQRLKATFAKSRIPDAVVRDYGPQFSSAEFHKLARDLDFSHITLSPHHPQGNGHAERAVQTAKRILRKRSGRRQPFKKEIVTPRSLQGAVLQRNRRHLWADLSLPPTLSATPALAESAEEGSQSASDITPETVNSNPGEVASPTHSYAGSRTVPHQSGASV